jgi:ribosome recycling factor
MVTSVQDVLKEVEYKMKKTVEANERELSTIRTGRANPTLVEGIKVSCYDTSMALKQLASISNQGPRLIVIQPWDRTIIAQIEKAILASDLGITPNNDGKVIRISIPSLTKERRDELGKVTKRIAEEGKVSLRTARRVANEGIDRLEKDKIITEDDKFKHKDKVQKLIDRYSKEIDTQLAAKEREIQEV